MVYARCRLVSQLVVDTGVVLTSATIHSNISLHLIYMLHVTSWTDLTFFSCCNCGFVHWSCGFVLLLLTSKEAMECAQYIAM